MSKRFALRGSSDIEFRFEAFNLLIARISVHPTATAAPAAFGTITSTYDPRQLQLGFKFNF